MIVQGLAGASLRDGRRTNAPLFAGALRAKAEVGPSFNLNAPLIIALRAKPEMDPNFSL